MHHRTEGISASLEQRILSFIEKNRRELVRTCSELIQIDSSNPPGDCSDLVRYLSSEYKQTGARFSTVSADRDYLKRLGHRHPRNNFVSCIGPKRARSNVGLAIGTHMDVVPAGSLEKWRYPPFSGTVANSKIWGRGACDAKCSLASQLYATKAILDSGAPLGRSLVFIGTVDDEAPGDATGPGMEFMVHEGLAKLGYGLPKFAINAEASGLQSIWGSFTGGLTLKITLKGRVGHPPVGVNALESATKLWNALISNERNEAILPKPPRLVWLCGGSSSDFGLTPERAEMIFRTPITSPRVSVRSAIGEIKRVIQQERKRDPRILAQEIKVLTGAKAFEVGESNSLVRALKSAAAKVGVKAAYGGGIVGPGDLMFFLSNGVPGVTYGAGSLERCHVPNEYVTEEELTNQAKIYALAALTLCSPQSG
ncbi:MAG TPA: M20/M25/M40 family metallo-hydrolase [Nitrososphaerales archaeon]|nr:M20/M25/M40 family metallo-hydrolase [Nitrososphaerales archaeon]